jgi:uncharacterized membrane protein HdeD (DUF308 family)
MSHAHAQTGHAIPLLATVLLAKLAENWWLLLLRGIAAVGFGLIAFFWPGITLLALTYLWGAYAIADGVIAIWAAFNAAGGDTGTRWWLGLSGFVGIVAGGVAFFWPGMTAFVLLMFIAAWAFIIGVLQIYGAVQLRKVIDNEWWLALSGVVSIGFAVIMVGWPNTGALALVWTIAWYAVFFGCLNIGLAFRLKKYKQT